jgi:hypothetical protein
MNIGARPIVMQMSVLATHRIDIRSLPIVMEICVWALPVRIGLIPYGYRSSADSYADERVGDTAV